MKNVYELEVFNDKNITASALIIGSQPKNDPYVKINIYNQTGLIIDMCLPDKDLERFAVNILKSIKSKKIAIPIKQEQPKKRLGNGIPYNVPDNWDSKNQSQEQPKQEAIEDKKMPDIEELIEKFLPNKFDLSTFKPKQILFLKSAFQQGAAVMFHELKNRSSDKAALLSQQNPNSEKQIAERIAGYIHEIDSLRETNRKLREKIAEDKSNEQGWNAAINTAISVVNRFDIRAWKDDISFRYAIMEELKKLFISRSPLIDREFGNDDTAIKEANKIGIKGGAPLTYFIHGFNAYPENQDELWDEVVDFIVRDDEADITFIKNKFTIKLK